MGDRHLDWVQVRDKSQRPHIFLPLLTGCLGSVSRLDPHIHLSWNSLLGIPQFLFSRQTPTNSPGLGIQQTGETLSFFS